MAGFGKMMNMARTPAEVKEDIERSSPSVAPKSNATAPVYPYGLCISLDEESLAKLKIDGDLPDVGDMIHFCAMARVTSASEREEETAGGEKKVCRRVELQITDLGMENEAAENEGARRDRFYGAEPKSEAA